ncbi:lytic transglycosylase domain-containing protein [Aeromicrobium piscarium]|uniref:Transglycosylase SLT domain-containing protein n=1 Tax=Aeromicrobium piscarium TaxID=2590901 RepID=A0A554SPM6_9ACTN|nr:lytic murein transglycosylase [Aeromicrobium piscarium]TSD68278.1 hypothetical protein FNM00_01410 [Aeromicrobium piscarium]
MSSSWRTLPRWQRIAAVVPAGLLVGATAVAVAGPGLATADSEYGAIPEVPDTPFESPASVEKAPAGIDPKAGAEGTLDSLASDGIPQVAANAYRRAAGLLKQADASCNLPWHLVAAIGRVESDHGRVNGNNLDSDGNAQPGIYGIPLNGKNGTALIRDTDDGKLDKDTEFDRAIGPMQFIPTTWDAVGIDADQDGTKNPQNIHDAATASAIYLCAGDGDLSARDDLKAAVKRYNNSDEYVDLVLKISDAYSKGNFSTVPTGSSKSSVLTSFERDQTMTPAERQQATERAQRAAEQKRVEEEQRRSGGGSGGGGGGTGGGDGGSEPPRFETLPETNPAPGGGGGSGSAPRGPVSDVTDPITDGVDNTVDGVPVVEDVVKPVTRLISKLAGGVDWVLNSTDCRAKSVRLTDPRGNEGRYQQCMTSRGYEPY